MRVGFYEIQLIDQDGHQLDEVLIDHHHYIVAIPGKEYKIKIIVHKDQNTNNFPANNMRIGLYVDGQDVQYWKRLDTSLISSSTTSINSIFHGYKKGTDDLRSFIFAKTIPTAHLSHVSSKSSSSDPGIPTPGTIKVVIYEAEQIEGIIQNLGGKYEVPGQYKVNVDEKFYKQPSVTTMGGRNIHEAEQFIPLIRWRNKSDIPLITLNLFYHSPEMIQFLQLFHEMKSSSDNPSPSNGIKRKINEIIDLSDDSIIIPSPPNIFSIQSNTVIKTVSPTHTSTSSGTIPSYTIAASEYASDDVEVLTVIKEVPLYDITNEDENDK